MVESSVLVRYRLRSCGQVMWVNICSRVAPSIRAASYRSCGIAIRPARRIRVQNGRYFQMWTVITEPKARCGRTSHQGASMPNQYQRMLLSMPHSEFSIHRNDRMVGIEGTAQGRMKMMDSQRIQGLVEAKKPDSSNARNSLRLMPMPRKIAVLITVRA